MSIISLGLINTAEALPVLVKQLAHPARWVRCKAAEAVGKMGGTAKPAVEGILKPLVATAEPSWPIRWEDPVQFAHGQLASRPVNKEKIAQCEAAIKAIESAKDHSLLRSITSAPRKTGPNK